LVFADAVRAFEVGFSDLPLDPGLAASPPLDPRLAAPRVVAVIASCLPVTVTNPARALAPGLTARAMLEKLSTIQRVDVHLPATDGRQFVLPRYTQPDADQRLLLQRLKLTLPEQPPPRIQANQLPANTTTANSL